MSTTTPKQLNTIRTTDPESLLIDVRTPAEFQEVHAKGAINIPLDGFEPANVISSHQLSSEKPVYLICKSGGRSQQACEALAAAGLESAVNVTGGTEEWVAEDLPVVRSASQAPPRRTGGG